MDIARARGEALQGVVVKDKDLVVLAELQVHLDAGDPGLGDAAQLHGFPDRAQGVFRIARGKTAVGNDLQLHGDENPSADLRVRIFFAASARALSAPCRKMSSRRARS